MYPHQTGVLLFPLGLPGNPQQATAISQGLQQLPSSFVTSQVASTYNPIPQLLPNQDQVLPWLRAPVSNRENIPRRNSQAALYNNESLQHLSQQLTSHLQLNQGNGSFLPTQSNNAVTSRLPGTTLLERPTAIRPQTTSTSLNSLSNNQLWPMMQLMATSDGLYHLMPSGVGSLFTTTANGTLLLNNTPGTNHLLSTNTSEESLVYDTDSDMPPTLTAYGMEKETDKRTKEGDGTVVKAKEPISVMRTSIPAPEDPPHLLVSPSKLRHTTANPAVSTIETRRTEEEKKEKRPLVAHEASGFCASVLGKMEKNMVEMKAPIQITLGCPTKQKTVRKLLKDDLVACLSRQHKRVTEAINGSRSGRGVQYGRGKYAAIRRENAEKELARRHEKIFLNFQYLENLDICVVETANNEIFESNVSLLLDTTQVLRTTICKVAGDVDFSGQVALGPKKPLNPRKKPVLDGPARRSKRIATGK